MTGVATVTASVQCANPDCRVAETEKCVEGLELSDCPHYGRGTRPVDTAPVPVETVTVEALQPTETPLPSAGRLGVPAAEAVLRAGATRVVAVIGPLDAGKTSLIASLYDLFQNGPGEAYSFAQSRTLHAFEQACHHARAASLRAEPDMDRTQRGGVTFYHLGLGGPDGDRLDLVLGDRSGEEYLDAADDPSNNADFIEVRRADALTILVDGQRLLDTAARHNVRSEVEMLLQALVDGGTVAPGQALILVLTKLDAVHGSSHRSRAETDFAALVEGVRRLFAHTFETIEAHQVAASPKSDVLRRGFGVPTLLRAWAARSQPRQPTATVVSPTPQRAFARLTPFEG
jgi:hypothetical protein